MSRLVERVGWNDLLGQLVIRGSGTAAPAYAQIGATGMYSYNFVGTGAQLKEAFMDYHVPHDYAVGTDMYIHLHWLPDDTSAGNTKWYFQIAYAKGYNQAVMTLGSLTNVNVVQASPTIQYQHMIAEVQFSNSGGTGGLLNSNNIQTDGIFMVRMYRDPADVADTYAATAWVTYIDIHYQSKQVSTLNRNVPFEP